MSPLFQAWAKPEEYGLALSTTRLKGTAGG